MEEDFAMSDGQGSAPAAQIAQFRSDGFTAASGLRVPFFSDGFARAYGFPEIRLVNMLSEATPLREERPYTPLVGLREVRFRRAGLRRWASVGGGPIRGMHYQAGEDALYVVSGTTLFVNGAAFADAPGSDLVRFAASENQVVLCADGAAYCIAVGRPGAPRIDGLGSVSDVAWLGGYFVFAIAGRDIFYYSAPGDGSSVPGLNFESAESFPDPITALAVLDDELVALGSQSVQFFSLSGDADAPFTPAPGRNFQRGCLARDAVCFGDNALVWVADNGVVYRSAASPARISSSSIEERIAASSDPAAMTAFVATVAGHELYVLNVPGEGSFAYDFSRVGETLSTYGASGARGEWGQWTSFGRPLFRGRCAAAGRGATWLGDDATGDVWTLDPGAFDDGGDPLTAQASAFIKIEEGTPRCASLVLHAVQGVGTADGHAADPVAEMRYSDDLGASFSPWLAAPLGRQGRAGPPRAMWQRLGRFRAPGRLVEVRVSDPVNVAFSHLELNAARPAW
jgi:hypothetical protein